jgi:hypothetical protein
MKRILFVCFAVVVASELTAQRSLAQDPAEILDHYRLLPRFSTLRQTGGFAGVNWLYRLTGEYDLRHGMRPNQMAAFENAEFSGELISNRLPAPDEIDVDEILNLEGLKGMALPVAAPFDVYRFRGSLADESSVELFAAVLGRWMFIRGGTQPPPGSGDFFEYHIRALARSGPSQFADFNEDGSVDAADYVAWRNAVRTSGDDGLAGYADWRHQFGEAVPDIAAIDVAMSSAMASFVAAAGLPEPASLGLAIGAGFLIAGRRRRADRVPGDG